MAKVFADKTFVGVWKCKSNIKEIVFNNTKLDFPKEMVKIVTISNTQGGTIFYMGQPSPDAKGFPASRAAGIAVEFIYTGKNDQFILKETMKINIVDTANLVGESTQEWMNAKKELVAKTITRSTFHRVGRMRT